MKPPKNTYIMRDQVNDRVTAIMSTDPSRFGDRARRFAPRLIASTFLLAYVAVATLG